MFSATPPAARRNAGWRSGPRHPRIRARLRSEYPSLPDFHPSSENSVARADGSPRLFCPPPPDRPGALTPARPHRLIRRPIRSNNQPARLGGDARCLARMRIREDHMRLSTLAAAAGLAATAAAAASAQDYPTGPVTIVVPFAAGGPTDTVTRLVAEPMSAAARPADRRAERRRRRRHPRRHPGRQGRARRLHAAPAPHRHVDGALALRRPRLRPGDRLRADRPRHQRPDDDHRPQGLSSRTRSRS